ncbi:MAG: 2Fe-2S iron-sulfur cluster-binding protein [Geminicoccaceae bacterium]
MSASRLPEPWGHYLDRSRPLSFTFEGRRYQGFQGDTLASALLANGVDVISRSFKYHRPRGVLTMRGLDSNCYVQVGDEPNVAADRLPLTEGLVATGQNYVGSLERDRDRWIERVGRFLPVGFYYKSFFKPKGAWAFWEPTIRAKAGLGVIDRNTHHGYHDKEYLFCDVAVVGGGPAGLQAARVAADAGADTILIDDEPRVGGSLLYERAPDGRTPTLATDGISVLSNAVCTGLFADNWLAVVQGDRLFKLRAREVVLATGTVEQPMVFRNNDLPGVILASAAQRCMRLWGIKPGRRAVVVTANEAGYCAAMDLLQAGVAVAAVCDLRQEGSPGGLADDVAARGIEVRKSWTVTEALPGRAGPRHEGAVLSPIDGSAEPVSLSCDLIVTSVGYSPLGQLACHAGAHLAYDEELASFRVENLPPHVHLAGGVNHRATAAGADGARAGLAAAAALGLSGKQEAPPHLAAECHSHPWPIFPHPKGKDFVDVDEDQTVHDLLDAVSDGFDSPELAKRYTTTGMGPSQGRLSSLNALRIVQKAAGRPAGGAPVTTQRPPFLPESFGVLAGRGFEPTRLTAMHHQHVALGAQQTPAGLWLRPAYYGPPESRERAIAAEVRAVRTGVGLIDVSTLGGLEVRGPDAAELLNRVYTMSYTKLPVGRTRYVLACDQSGAIIDDGVACRLAEDWFYVTATTSGVDVLYRAMLRWNAEWRLTVDVANVTAAYAGVNIAGPKSRDVLRRLDTDIELSPEAFPYLAVRTGTLAGIPVRLLRVGFVGELGYEIHCPASYGAALWDLLLQTGQRDGIRPFGVEAQRVLRLEKGHIIVGQDTDGLTFPQEAGMSWAIAKNKPFFLGQRAIEVMNQRGLTRQLVGFRLPPDAPVPPECVLVIRDGDIVGRVTSATRSEACGAIVGLAYVHPDDAAPGSRFTVKLEDGSTIEPTVVELPFYDPETKRQEL